MRPACAATVSRAISSAALLAAFLTATAVKSGNLGPGSKPWVPEPAGAHGLDPAKLTAAWDQLHAHASLDRKCLVVIKDGALVFEGYANDRGFNASSVHDGWSMTKTLGVRQPQPRHHFGPPAEISQVFSRPCTATSLPVPRVLAGC